ncbi:MAG TPA: hypothetical protein VKA95_11160 [Nitrososphaeraceae archaeon]|jgi:hypothetical protein|nr:hypothetical protein [Nitrososphaeraceae archaeon]
MESSSMPPAASKVIQTNNKEVHEELVSITEKIDLTKKQHEVLKIICNTYEISLLEYIQQAVVEAMRFDIEEGNFSDALLEKLGGEDSNKKNNIPTSPPSSVAPDLMKRDLDLLKRLQTEIA